MLGVLQFDALTKWQYFLMPHGKIYWSRAVIASTNVAAYR